MRRTSFPVLLALAVSACSTPGGPYPSLQPRAAETIDPRLPVERPMNARPVNAALAARLSDLVAQARSGDADFQPLAARAEQLAAAAAAPQSESWIAAEEALSAAVGARAPTTRALGDIDAIGGDKLQAQSGLAPSDLAAIEAAGAEVGAIDRAQAARVKAIQDRLAG
jgi:hypothetical protein